MPKFDYRLPTPRMLSPQERLSPHEQISYDINSVGCLYKNHFSSEEISLALGLSIERVKTYIGNYLAKESSQKTTGSKPS